jgi:glycosyltransferase involved in cell wall biosynthesis
MRILNIMLSAEWGGIQQSFVDYTKLLAAQGHEVLCVCVNNAATLVKLPDNISVIQVNNFGNWDFFASFRVANICATNDIDLILAHGNRAIKLTKKTKCRVIAVAHNYKLKYCSHIDAVIAVSKHLAQDIIKRNIFAAEQVHYLPNMINATTHAAKTVGKPIIVGALGRFVYKKGFHIFIEAIGAMASRGYTFKVRIGGTGELEHKIKEMIRLHRLESVVTLDGWVDDIDHWYQQIDIFCLPSLHEPFGIVLLEAMLRRIPIVSTNAEGPSEIITDNSTGKLVPVGNAQLLAEALINLLNNPKHGTMLANNAYNELCNNYTYTAVGKKLSYILAQIGQLQQVS